MKCFHTLVEIYFLSVSDVIHPAEAVVIRLSGRGQARGSSGVSPAGVTVVPVTAAST